MTLEFLKKVLPEGLVVIATPIGKGFKQVVCNTMEDAVQHAEKLDAAGKDCYFGLGSLLEPFVMGTKDGKPVKEVRVGRNIASMRCLYIDIDVEAGNPKKYESQIEAFTALRTFCKEAPFLAPMIVNSGGGLHAYWPFDEPMAADTWRALASSFKAGIGAYGLKTDVSITADASRVLRVVGTHNYKAGMKRPVEILKNVAPYTQEQVQAAVAALTAKHGVIVVPQMPRPTAMVPFEGGGNLATEYPPSDYTQILQRCKTMAGIAETGGPGGVIWMHGLGVAMHTDTPDEACLAVSDRYPDFDVAVMQRKLYRLKDQNIKPTLCATFCTDEGNRCEGCPHLGKIKSPIVLGFPDRVPVVETISVVSPVTGVTTVVPVVVRPHPYGLDDRKRVVVRKKNDAGIEELLVVHDHDIRPIKRTHSERHSVESTLWTAEIPKAGWVEFTLEQSILAKPETLHAALLSKGVYVTPGRIKLMVSYMVAYIKELQKTVITEQLFSRLGWRDDFSKFVLGGTVFNSDGTEAEHQIAPELISEVPGLGVKGTLDGWKKTIQFYNAPGYEAHRTMLYSGFGSLLLHMTGHKGVVIAATGEPGAGKTTSMMASNSVFGHPEELIVSGNQSGATENALYSLVAARNHLPMALDEVTRMDLKILGKYCLAIPQGKGKRVNTRAGVLSQNVPTWGNITQMSANTDMYAALAQSRADATAETVRLFQLAFVVPETNTKTQADQFLRDLKANYGHAGPVFIRYVITHYEKVKARVEAVMALVDTKADISSGERFWAGLIAAEFVGGMIARHLGLLDGFPIEQDFEWNIAQLKTSRASMVDNIATSRDVLSEFLEARVGETLVVSQTLKSNMSARVDQAPRGALSIRHETDSQRLYITRTEFKKYCQEIGANYRSIQIELEENGVLLNKCKPKVLGAGTEFSKGQIRCWEIDVGKLQ